MPIINHMIGKGIAVGQASAITGGTGETSTVITAGTAGQSTATLIASGAVYVSICSSSGKSVKLPSCDPNSSIELFNGGAAVLGVYGQTGEGIQGGSANAVFYVGVNKSCTFTKYSATVWGANLSA